MSVIKGCSLVSNENKTGDEITPEEIYLQRREFIKNALLFTGTTVAVGGGLLGLMKIGPNSIDGPSSDEDDTEASAEETGSSGNGAGHSGLGPISKNSAFTVPEDRTPYKSVTTYNNYYEFGADKGDPATNAGEFQTRPWTVSIEGECRNPQVIDIDQLLKWFPLEERVYRMRCVEAWSMVIPWVGFPLGDLIRRMEPTSKAKYVAFTTLNDPERMPGQKRAVLPWPYVEGLRLDEAMHPLALLAVGLYGKVLPNQNGAPIRLVTPWKYGFKGIKAIVKIAFTEEPPPTTWNVAAPNEYGFYANVNPEVDHPRWSQATERRIGEFSRRATLPFNGYAEQVAGLYAGMDLRKFF